jgi:lysozyme family protein
MAKAPTWAATKNGYNNLWHKSDNVRDDAIANQVGRIMVNKHLYQKVQAATGVPWPLISALHSRESNLSFLGILHSGERIIGTGRKSTKLVPKGVGPFDTWHASAVHAMQLKALHLIKSWPAARMLYEAEQYNGWGYTWRGINSPYLWAGTTLEQPGKFIKDHVFSSTAIDKQLGVAAILRGIADVDLDAAKMLGLSVVPPVRPVAVEGDGPTKGVEIDEPVIAIPGNTVTIGQHLKAIAVLMDVDEVTIAATVVHKK